MQIKINEKTYQASSVYGRTEALAGFNRDVITMILDGTYADVSADFISGAMFTVVDDNGGEYTYDTYGVAGPITDNRDGTCTIKMGKNNTAEQDALEAKNEAEKQTQKVSMDLVILAGKSLSGESNEISELRKSFEAACSKLSDADMLIAPSLAPSWDIGQNIAQGERRYYRPNATLHKALKPHISSLENGPGNTEYWEEV